MSFKPIIFGSEQGELVPIDDEIFLELRQSEDSRFLSKTCYGIAVQECVRLTGESFLLQVRPDMRTLLISQLAAHCIALRVYRKESEPGTRFIFTGRMCIRFTEWSSQEDRRAFMRSYFPSRAGEEPIQDGMYPLECDRSRDLRQARHDLALEGAIISAAPVVLAVPAATQEAPRENLLALAQTQLVKAVVPS